MSKILSNLIWRFLERCGAQGVTLIVSLILARLLDPEVYGTVALVTVFITIVQVFVDSGLGTALIQKKNADDLDFSSVFFFNLALCIAMYFALFFAAPFISVFYKMPDLTAIIRVLGLVIVFSGVKNVQQAYVSRNLLFKKFFFSTLTGTIAAAVIGIYMAYSGYGVWAIVFQMLVNTAVDTIILWIIVKWRPKMMFSLQRLKGLYSYGWKLLVSALIDTGFNKLQQMIIGKVYTKSSLAFYNQGEQYPLAIVSNINASIDSVLLPVMSKAQDDPNAVKNMTRRAIKTSTYIIMPCMVGLGVCAEPLISLLLTDKWLPCVFFLRVFCFSYAFWPIHTANLNAINALGRSDLFLKLEIIKKIVVLLATLSTMFISVKAMACSVLVTAILGQMINSWPNKKLMDYSYFEQVKDMLPQIILSFVMGVSVYCVRFIGLADIFTLLIQIPSGVLIYWLLSKLLHIDSYEFLIDTVRGLLNKKGGDI